MTASTSPDHQSVRSRLTHVLEPIQDRIALQLGVDPGRRGHTVVAMIDSNVRRAPGYWVQLFLAAGIATLGLALDSTAVVIGAMLVSPLMGPIVELGMGFAVGSSLLVLRAALCVALSVGGVIGASALMTLALPFHEVTSEIAARTAPTLLDLLIAAFCALVATYTTIRQTADTTAAAAGTAIGIALVPPLCVTGFGIGTGSLEIAGGALLLFVANFSAIVVLATVVFALLGYARVDAVSVEHDFLDSSHGRTTRVAERAHRALRGLFGSQYGHAMRLLVPAVFLLVVFVPLRTALDDVATEVRVRQEVRRLLAAEAPRAVQSAIDIDRDRVVLNLLVIGTADEARRTESALAERIATVAGITPSVSVTAVPDAEALTRQVAAAVRPAPTGSAARFQFALVRQRVQEVLAASWPRAGGTLAGWSLQLGPHDVPTVTVRHFGSPLGIAAEELLAARLSDAVGTVVRIVDRPLPAEAVLRQRTTSDGAWPMQIGELSAEAATIPDARICIGAPINVRRREAAARVVLDALQSAPRAREARLEVTPATAWSVRIAQGPCGAD